MIEPPPSRYGYIKALVDAAPPLTSEQRDRLAMLLHGVAPARGLNSTPPPPPPAPRCALYRHWDKEGNLLYIGITVNPEARRRDHARHSAWVEFAAREEVEWFDSRMRAEDAEKSAIQDEAPLFNWMHSDPARDKRLTAYLIAHGSFHLLRPL